METLLQLTLKEFADFTAVDDVSSRCPGRVAGDRRGSGSGKTTIARMIVGLERADDGHHHRLRPATAPGPPSALDRRRRGREVQIVFQDPYTSLDPRQTGRRPIDEVLRLHHGWPAERRRERIAELTGLVGLDDRQAQALPRALSAGSGSASRSPAPSPPSPAC